MNTIKNLFSTPKKTLLTILGALMTIAVLGMGTVFATGAIAKSASIGEENAKNFAFADAGVDPTSATAVQAEFSIKQGQFVYEVEFTADGVEYDYWIKASDGSVVAKETEPADTVAPENPAASQPATPNATASDAAPVSSAATPEQPAASAKITLENAKKIALSDAGVSASKATFTKTKQDYDDGVLLYDVEFYTASHKYEYEINAETGAVYSKSKEQRSTGATATPPKTTQGAQTDLKQAKKIALSDAGVSASKATFTKTKQDYDDGVLVYDIEFYTATRKYEYEIDAATGAIRSRDAEPYHSGDASVGNAGYIGIDQAKTTAVKHAGFSLSEVVFSKAKLDHDDGYTVYELEFYKDGMEYEYTINARTGDILEYDSDWEDD